MPADRFLPTPAQLALACRADCAMTRAPASLAAMRTRNAEELAEEQPET